MLSLKTIARLMSKLTVRAAQFKHGFNLKKLKLANTAVKGVHVRRLKAFQIQNKSIDLL